MNDYVIMHNMIKSERDTGRLLITEVFDFQWIMAEPQPSVSAQFSEFLAMHQQVHDETTHKHLQNDPVTPLWAIKANNVV